MNFIAIDFETANGKRASICEVGICVVRNGEIDETRSWLVQPEGNYYSYWNVQCHGITPEDTEEAPSFPEVWREIEAQYFDTFELLGANGTVLRDHPSGAAVGLLATPSPSDLQLRLQQPRLPLSATIHTRGETSPRRR